MSTRTDTLFPYTTLFRSRRLRNPLQQRGHRLIGIERQTGLDHRIDRAADRRILHQRKPIGTEKKLAYPLLPNEPDRAVSGVDDREYTQIGMTPENADNHRKMSVAANRDGKIGRA